MLTLKDIRRKTDFLYSLEVLLVLDGKPVGYVRKFRDTATEKCPHQVFAMDGVHPQTGEPCVGTLLGTCYDCPDWKSWASHIVMKSVL